MYEALSQIGQKFTVADLERYAEAGSTNVRAIAARPLFVDLHDDPGFIALIDRLGLPRR